ncbi:MAG: glutathione S-transferase [Methylobacteriaceae bacterium]|nr:glutathione S-transferase [Methylobacteriaceae bacterium]
MKLFFSPASPYVRKVMIVAHELGLAGRIEKLPAAAGPVKRDQTIRPVNPIAQVPTLLTDDGTALYDSRVICEYLDDLGGGRFFGQGAERWRNLTDAALGDGLLGAALLVRYESVLRPEPYRWTDWIGGQSEKITDAADRIERLAPALGDRLDIGTVTLFCALGYLDFRFPDLAWRATRPAAAAWFERFSARPSAQATMPSG